MNCAGGTTKCGSACTDTQSDSQNCGGCGNACAAGLACSSGVCTLSCGGGTTKCGNLCTNTNNDAQNCGGCGTTCGPYASASAVCNAGACSAICNAGKGDCNVNLADGCEASLATDVQNCGACGVACAGGANASAKCAGASCGLQCNANYGNCDASAANGCETNLLNTVSACGGCGNACASPSNAQAACSAGACGFTCNANYGNCDANAANGCETDLTSSNADCGSCGNACGAGLTCNGGSCGGLVLGSLNGKQTNDLTRGQTQNAFFSDPITGKVYWGQGYTGNQIAWYANMTAFINNSASGTITLSQDREGTYHAAMNGYVYYAIFNTNTMARADASTGQVLATASLPNAGYHNQSAFNWGGY